MNGYKGKNLADTISAAGSMILFLIFSACMLIIIAAAAGAYGRISDSYGEAFSTSSALKYVSNKIRSFDMCEEYDGAVLLSSDGLYCLIWCENGGIYEKTSVSGIPARSGGDKVFDADTFEFSEKGALYSVAVSYGGEKRSVLIRKG